MPAPMVDRVRDLDVRVASLLAADPASMADAQTTWNELRNVAPVHRRGDTVLLSRHGDVRELIGDNSSLYTRAGTRHSGRYVDARGRFDDVDRAAFDDVLDHEFSQLVRVDAPDHIRLRRTVQPPFSVKRLAEEMSVAVEQRVWTAIDELDRLGRDGSVVDFKRFAYTVPLQVLGDLLGIAFDDLDLVHSWAARIGANKFNADSGAMARVAAEAYRDLDVHIEGLLVGHRRSGRSTGLVTAVIDAIDAGQITHTEAVGMLSLMIFAGHETTSGLLSIGVMELLRRPDQWRALRDDPDLAPAAAEELLRFVTPAQFLQYVAAGPRQIGGVQIDAGDTVIGIVAAANRDPDVFDAPDQLNITRADSRHHLSLGVGPHFCLGAGLARIEADVVLRALVERFPHMSLATDTFTWAGSGSMRAPLTMPVRLAR